MEMSTEQISVKYTVANDQAIKPRKATIDSAGYDLFAAESKILQPVSFNVTSLELNMEIRQGFFWKIHLRCGLLLNHFVSCDGGVIDSGYRGIIKVIMTNQNQFPCEVCIGQITAQIIFHKTENVTFTKVDDLAKTERQLGGFGSTGYLKFLF